MRQGPTERELAAIQASEAKACCKQRENLTRQQPRPDLAVNTCQACGCRHHRLSAAPQTKSGALSQLIARVRAAVTRSSK